MHPRATFRRVLSLSLLSAGLISCGNSATVSSADSGPNPGPADAASSGSEVDANLGTDAGALSDLAEPGPFGVVIDNAVTAPIGDTAATLTVCSPSSDAGATAAAGPFPLVITSPGFQLPRTQYASMCSHLASWGFVVLSRDYQSGGILSAPNHQTLAEQVGLLIDWALGDSSMLAGRLDSAMIAVAGHSLGGKVSILAATLDDRIGAVVGWDPVDANPPTDNGSPSVTPELMSGLTIPIAVIGETLDSTGSFQSCAPAADNYAQYFENACQASDVLEVTIDGADHMDWIDDRGSCGFTCFACQSGSADDATTRETTRRVTTAWLRKHLLGTPGMDAILEAPGIGATVRSTPACN